MRFLGFMVLIALTNVSYATDKYHAQKQLVIQDKIVKFEPYKKYIIPSTNTGLAYYYRTENPVEQERLAELIATKVFEKIQNALGNEPIPENPQPSPNPENPQPSNPDDTLAALKPEFTNSCASCHTGTEKTGYSIFKADGTWENLTKADWWKIFDRVDGTNLPRDKVMPKNGQPLSDNTVNLIRNQARKAE